MSGVAGRPVTANAVSGLDDTAGGAVAARRLFIAVGLCVVAAVCRFVLFDRIEFKYDEAQVSSLALALMRQHVLPSSSILTSGGLHNPPLFVYLVAIPMVVSASPLIVTGFITALNALAAGGLYLVCRRAVGNVAAVTAGLLMAVNPLAVHYSRKIWAPDLMPPFTVLFLWGVLLAIGERRAWGLVLALAALGVLVQLHQAAAALVLVLAVLLVVFVQRLPLRRSSFWLGLLGGLLAFALLLLPYAVFEWRGGFADLKGMVHQVGAPAHLTFAPWLWVWQLAAGWNPELFFQPLAAQEHPSLAGSGPADWLTLALLLVSIGVCLVWLVRPDAGLASRLLGYRRVAAAALLLAVLLPPALFMRSAAPILPHYLVFLTPLLYALQGIGLAALGAMVRRPRLLSSILRLSATGSGSSRSWRILSAATMARGRPRPELPPTGSSSPSHPAPARMERGLDPGALVSVLGLLALTAVALVRLTAFDVQLRSHVSGGDYGVPLGLTLQAVAALGAPPHPNGAAASAATVPRVFVASDNSDLWAVYQYLAAAGSAPVAAFVKPDLSQVFPAAASPARYLFTATDTPAFHVLTEGAAGLPGAAPTWRVPDVPAPAYTVVRLDQQALQRDPPSGGAALRPMGPFTVGGGLTLTAGSLPVASSGPLAVTLLWQVADPAPFRGQSLQMFVHLYDASRHTLAQQDALGYPVSFWQRGDRFLTWFHLEPTDPLPAGTYTLVAGLYTVEGIHVVPVRGPRGEDLGGEIPLGTLVVGTR